MLTDALTNETRLEPFGSRCRSYSGAEATNPAMIMATITVNQMTSAGMTEIMTGLTHRYWTTDG